MSANLAKYRKVLAAFVAMLPAPAVLAVLEAIGVHVSAGVVAAVLAAAAAILAPTAVGFTKNTP